MRKTLGILLLAMATSGAIHAQQETYREAYDRGYQDGSSSGEGDRAAQRPFDFANKAVYQEGLQGFDPERHQRDVYIVAYRRGFEDGYEVGYGLDRAAPTAAPVPPPVASSMAPQPRAAQGGRTVLPAGTEILVRLAESLSTQRNEAGDQFRAEVLGPDASGIAPIPAGSRLVGTVTHVKRPGRVRGRAEITLAFEEVILPDGTALAMSGTVVDVEPRRADKVSSNDGTIQAPGEKGDDVKRVGASAGIGALIGILTGGGGGARAGAVIGAATGTVGVLATRGNDLLLPAETELLVRLERDLTVPTGVLRPEPQP